MALEVYLVRHGKTVFNKVGRLQGWSDSPLLPEGQEAARALGRALKGKVEFDAAFCSISPRAADTAKLILEAKGQSDLALQVIEEVREYCFGGFEGDLVQNVHGMIARQCGYESVKAWLEAYRTADYHMLAESVSVLDPLGLAENEARFMGRLKKGLEKIAGYAPENGKVLLVSHGMAITGILKLIDKKSTLYKSVENATVSLLQFNNDKWEIEYIGKNFAAHHENNTLME
ncbi:histidine phosphatase family protein [Neisseria sp. CCUG12390]|uniref:histidine phosphatase family protein n=1 Tax=Neisseria sp. CCUG12390 TaxID=3392035 RepID=UPI003A0FFDB6